MLLVESPFAGWFFPLKRFIKQVLIWSVFKLLVFLFAGCLFLEVPSFSGCSGQFERKLQDLEWGPLDLTLSVFAVFYLLNKLTKKNIECRHTSSKDAVRKVYIFPFNILLQTYWFENFSCFWSNLLSLAVFSFYVLPNKYWFEVFSSFWSSFLLAAFSLKFLVLAVVAVNLSGKSKTPRF